ncbi:MAG TPA: PmoA family protein [Candidatus Paceibacterota bacterium]|nr:PmoA family protein [Candidatus Paceibacterota bacterium]
MKLAFRISLAFVSLITLAARAADRPAVVLTPLEDRVRVEINGALLTEYYFTNVPRPYCYPLLGPKQRPMTRNFPMRTVEGEERDHPHHRSLWFTHGAVNGHDFWSEQRNFGRIVHQRFETLASGREVGTLKSSNCWISAEGQLICTDERTLRFYKPAHPGERLIDFEVTIYASQGPVTFGDTKEGSMAVRIAETMRLKGNLGKGRIVNSEGVRDDKTWGKRAKWCDYYGPVDGDIVGIAILDHPSNPRHPTWWHVRDYGLFAANPFGKHDFEKLSDKTAGDLVVPAGRSITFRYRILLHEGDERQGKVAEHYQRFVEGGAGF